jgi:streptogramin lyase
LANAFNSVASLVNLSTGAIPGPNLPSGAILPVEEINTLANILSTCVNSAGGSADDGTPCGKLLAAATPPAGLAPIDTISATLNIAHFPINNVATLYTLSPPSAPFQPTLPSAPTNLLIAIKYASPQLSGPTKVAIDAQGSIWVVNHTGNSVSQFSNTGSALSSSPYMVAGISLPADIAIDATGSAWVTNMGNNSVTKMTAVGGAASGMNFADSSLSSPNGIAIDALGNAWIANTGTNTLTELSNTGTALSPASGFTGAGLSAPTSIAINVR